MLWRTSVLWGVVPIDVIMSLFLAIADRTRLLLYLFHFMRYHDVRCWNDGTSSLFRKRWTCENLANELIMVNLPFLFYNISCSHPKCRYFCALLVAQVVNSQRAIFRGHWFELHCGEKPVKSAPTPSEMLKSKDWLTGFKKMASHGFFFCARSQHLKSGTWVARRHGRQMDYNWV